MIEVLKQSAEDVSKAYDVLAFAHTERALEILAKTRTSLRQAIAELESQEPVCPECKAEVLYECVACSRNNYPPQRTEQEIEAKPVARNECGRITWMVDDWPQNCLLYTHAPNSFTYEQVKAHIRAASMSAKSQHTWQSLTDEDVNNAIKEKNIAPLFTYRMIARTIEAKLKEKNI